MKVLFVCSLGMSSAVAIKALEKEAVSKGIEIEVKAVSTQQFEDEIKGGRSSLRYDCTSGIQSIRRAETVKTDSGIARTVKF